MEGLGLHDLCWMVPTTVQLMIIDNLASYMYFCIHGLNNVIAFCEFRFFRQCFLHSALSKPVSLNTATYLTPFLCPIAKRIWRTKVFLLKKSMMCHRVADRSRKKLCSFFDLKKLSGAFYGLTRFWPEREEGEVSWGEFLLCQGWIEKQSSMGWLKNIV